MNGFRTRALTVSVTVAALALALIADMRTAGAQDSKREQARAHFRAGQQAFDSNEYLVAVRAFEESYKNLPIPDIAFSMAQAYRLQYYVDGNTVWLRRAKERYLEYKSKKPKGRRLGDCLTHLGEIDTILAGKEASDNPMTAETPKITQVMIISQAKGARGTFKGEADDLPLFLDLDPGSYEVEVVADGFYAQKKKFTAVKDQFITVEVVMQPKKALVKVETRAGAQVAVDGRPEGETPLVRPLEVDEGERFIAVTRRGHKPWTEEVTLTRGQELTLKPTLPITTQRKVAYGFAAVGLAGVIATTVAAVGTVSSTAQAFELLEERNKEWINETELQLYNDLRTKSNSRFAITVGLSLFTGVAVITSGLLYYFDTPRIQRPSPRSNEPVVEDSPSILSVTPTVGPGTAGLSMTGRF